VIVVHLNIANVSAVGMARCAVTVAERSVRRRNEWSGSHSFGQRAKRLSQRVRFANSVAPPDAALGGADGAARRPYLPGKNSVELRPRDRSLAIPVFCKTTASWQHPESILLQHGTTGTTRTAPRRSHAPSPCWTRDTVTTQQGQAYSEVRPVTLPVTTR